MLSMFAEPARRHALEVAEIPSGITEDQLEALREAARKADAVYVEVRMHAGRAAVVARGCNEPVAYLLSDNANHARWVVAGWDRYFQMAYAEAREKGR